MVAVHYLEQGHVTWGLLTLMLIFVPSAVIQVFSLRWYAADGQRQDWHGWLVHGLLLQPLERYSMSHTVKPLI